MQALVHRWRKCIASGGDFGLVVRFPGYISRGPGSIPGATTLPKK
jgi:hypothetical protein